MSNTILKLIALLSGGGGLPAISVTGTTAFGTSPIGTTVSQVLTIQNTGSSTLTIGTITASGSSFTITAQAGSASLAPNATTTFTVRMEALAADAVAGAVSSTISIPNNSSVNPKTVAVSGTISILTSNLVSWHDASYAAGLWQDSARTTPATANADVVGAWDDRSGNNYHVIQATTGNKPTLRTAVKNGLNVVRGDGTDDVLTKTSYADFGDNYTVYLVMSYITGGVNQTAFYVSNGSSNTGFSVYHDGTTAKANYRDASLTRNIDSAVNLRDSTWRIHRSLCTGSQGQYALNAGAASTVAYTAPNGNTLNRLDLFGWGAISYFTKGDIAEILIYSATHDSTQQANMLAYLNAKWAVY